MTGRRSLRERRTFGHIARHYGLDLPLEILEGKEGFYIGTSEDGLPFTRESIEYFRTRSAAERALARGAWQQRTAKPTTGSAPDISRAFAGR